MTNIEHALITLLPDIVLNGDTRAIRDYIAECNVFIRNGRRHRLTVPEATFLTRALVGQPYVTQLIAHLTSGPVVLLHIEGHQLFPRLRYTLDRYPLRRTDSYYHQTATPRPACLRPVHVSPSLQTATQELALFQFIAPATTLTRTPQPGSRRMFHRTPQRTGSQP